MVHLVLNTFEEKIDKYRETLNTIKNRYGIGIDVDYAVKIESVQEAIRDKIKDVLEDSTRPGSIKEALKISETVYENTDFTCEREELKRILEEKGIEDDNYIELVIWQGVLQAVVSTIADTMKVYENRNAICPVCGNETDIGYIDGEGNIWLLCPVCGFTWIQSNVKNPVCPYCGLQDGNAIGVLKDKKNPNIMVMLCSHCKRYWIVLDDRHIRTVPRSLYPLLREKAMKILGSIPPDFFSG